VLQAAAAYRQILTIDPTHAGGHYALGNTLLALDRPAETEASCREALRLRPNLRLRRTPLGEKQNVERANRDYQYRVLP